MAKRKRKCTADQMETAAYLLLVRAADCLMSVVHGLSADAALDIVIRNVLGKQPRKRK
jgi:hypothetical protein